MPIGKQQHPILPRTGLSSTQGWEEVGHRLLWKITLWTVGELVSLIS